MTARLLLRVLNVWVIIILIFTASILAPPLAKTNLRAFNQARTIPSVSTAPVYQVSLDANSTSQTDTTVITDATQAKSFRIGAVINSSTTNPLTGIYGWQFAINYNTAFFVPQGDPNPSSPYPDGSANTALFGAQTTSGTVNWAGLVAAGHAFAGFKVCPGGFDECPIGRVIVYLALLAPQPAVSISAKTILGNVNFELVSKPSTPQVFTVSDVLFADLSGNLIHGPVGGPSISETITNAPPDASFTVSRATSVGPFAYIFDASSSSDPDGTIQSPSGYFWDFGDGTTDLGITGHIVTHDFGVNGTYDVTLRVQDSLGATGAARDSLGAVIVNNQPSHTTQYLNDKPPIALFTFYPDSAPSQSQFINFNALNSTDPDGTIISYQWSFGDGSTFNTSQSSTFHYYAQPGNYSVTLAAVDNANLTSSVSHLVFVLDEAPTAGLTFFPINPSYTQTITFNGTGSNDPDGHIQNWAWSFGDGSNATGPAPSHKYSGPGNYTVTLTVMDSSGLSGTYSIIVNARSGPADTPPIAIFTFNPSLNSSLVRFDGSNSTDPDGTIIQYHWDFGDGSLNLLNQPLVHHIYSHTGNYTVTLTVTDNARLTGSVSHKVPVLKAPTDVPPIATFTWKQTSSLPGSLGISLNATASHDPDGYIQTWTWSFGDGGDILQYNRTSDPNYGSTLLRGYLRAGNFTTTLTVTDNAGLSSSVSELVSVVQGPSDQPPIASFTFNPVNPSAGQAVTFNGTLSSDPDGSVQYWYWTFGDGFTGSGSLAYHIYSSPGNYTVTLTATDNVLLSTRISSIVQVHADEPPVPAFTFAPSNSTTGQTISFDGTGSSDPDGSIQIWYWTFGDGLVSSGSQVSHSYNSPGNYTVTLTVTDSSGLFASLSRTVTVHPDEPPTASFAFAPAHPQAGDPVFFAAAPNSDPDGFIQGRAWSFGDGSQGFGSLVEHTYNSPGNYTATLTVSDNNGLSATTSMVVPVHARPLHDVAITQVSAYPQVVVSSQTVDVQVTVTNNGSSNETVSVTGYYGSRVIGTLNGISLLVPPANCFFCSRSVYLQIPWDTSGVAAGNYTISATVFLSTDQSPSDNSMTDGQVKVLPPPLLTVTPSSGPPGTTVLVHATNFPPNPYNNQGIGYIEVTFDDQLIGFTNSHNGSFNFTFSIPLSQGSHMIKALDETTGAHTSASFQVLLPPAPGNLTVTVDVGTIYFPGETAIIYTQTNLNGIPVNPSSIQLQLFRPNGSSLTLSTQPVAQGLFKASFIVPKSGSTGTYLVQVKAHLNQSPALDANRIVSFEVKPPWLGSQNSSTLAVGVAATLLVGMVAIGWRRGYFKKREDGVSS